MAEKYPQDEEKNEYRYIDFAWLDEIAMGLTAGAKKHPGETWREIPARGACGACDTALVNAPDGRLVRAASHQREYALHDGVCDGDGAGDVDGAQIGGDAAGRCDGGGGRDVDGQD